MNRIPRSKAPPKKRASEEARRIVAAKPAKPAPRLELVNEADPEGSGVRSQRRHRGEISARVAVKGNVVVVGVGVVVDLGIGGIHVGALDRKSVV